MAPKSSRNPVNIDYIEIQFPDQSGIKNPIHANDVDDFILYPNPTKDRLYIQSSNNNGKDCLINIYDISGNKITSINFPGQNWIDVLQMAPNVYIAQFGSNGKFAKFIVE
jgi:hypothetical protein